MKREDAKVVGVVSLMAIAATFFTSLGVLVDSAFALIGLGLSVLAALLFVYWYIRFGR